jgi:hypothetical protein
MWKREKRKERRRKWAAERFYTFCTNRVKKKGSAAFEIISEHWFPFIFSNTKRVNGAICSRSEAPRSKCNISYLNHHYYFIALFSFNLKHQIGDIAKHNDQNGTCVCTGWKKRGFH